MLFAAIGVIWSPKLSGAIATATGNVVPVTVTVDVRGIPVANPAALVEAARLATGLAGRVGSLAGRAVQAVDDLEVDTPE